MNHIDCTTPWTAPIAFDFGPTERLGLCGPSGSGKTTLLRAIAGLVPEANAHVMIGGVAYEALPPERRNFGYVPQNGVLFPNFSVLDNVTFGLLVRGVKRDVRDEEGLRWLQKVGLESRASDRIDPLSGGEVKRVALIRALILRPTLLLLDEPFSALDPKRRSELRDMIRALHREVQIPILLVSHDAEDLADCDRVVSLAAKFGTD